MRIVMALAVAASALVSGATAATTPTPGGIRGTLIKGPTKPVCEVGVPCSAPAPGIALAFLRAGVRVATTTTSKAGTYRVSLRPGTYVVRTLTRLPFGSPQPRTVRVPAGRFAVANFEIDTGIR